MKKLLTLAAVVAVALGVAGPAGASTLTIQFTGLNLYYDGQDLQDAGGVAGGGIDGEIDMLASMSFFLDQNLLGVQTSNIYADVLIAGVGPILAAGESKTFLPTVGPGFDLFVAGGGLALDWDAPVTIDYNGVDLSLLGSGTTNTIVGQALPYGVVMGTPVLVTFSTQVTLLPQANGLNTTIDDRTVGPFTSFGSGDVSGPSAAVPEPATLLTIGFGLLGGGLVSRRRKKS